MAEVTTEDLQKEEERLSNEAVAYEKQEEQFREMATQAERSKERTIGALITVRRILGKDPMGQPMPPEESPNGEVETEAVEPPEPKPKPPPRSRSKGRKAKT